MKSEQIINLDSNQAVSQQQLMKDCKSQMNIPSKMINEMIDYRNNRMVQPSFGVFSR